MALKDIILLEGHKGVRVKIFFKKKNFGFKRDNFTREKAGK